MNFRHVKLLRGNFVPLFETKAKYSRRNNNCNLDKNYKVISNRDNESNQQKDNPLAPIPNWEILKPRGYKFILPGNVGLGWHDIRTNSSIPSSEFDVNNTNFKCYAQNCPILLRPTVTDLFPAVTDLFPGIDFSYHRLTVITLTQKKLRPIADDELETIVKMYVMEAQNICFNLREAGYWADFINPFSGLPGVNLYTMKNDLSLDESTFRGVGFRITERAHCRIIKENDGRCRFGGNIYTTAKAQADVLQRFIH